MTKSNRSLWLKCIAGFLFVVAGIVGLFIVSLYGIAMNTRLPGRSDGPQDAFRHTYASALVSRFLSPRVVELVTVVCERDDNSPSDRMDRHNNQLGMRIGQTNDDIFESVTEHVRNAEIEPVDSDVTFVLEKSNWGNGF